MAQRRGRHNARQPAVVEESAFVVFPTDRKELVSAIKQLDVYSNSKVASEYTVGSGSDGAGRKLSIFGYVMMGILTLSEIAALMRVEERDHLVVDTSLDQTLNISMDVTFHALTCSEVHLDAMDVAGDYHPYMEQHVRKQRLLNGKAIAQPTLERANVYEKEDCGSCYGAETDEIKCCNTCGELMRAYGLKGWSTNEMKKSAPQCVGSNGGGGKPSKGEGCNLAGWIEVKKVGGNFHVALGESTVRDGRFIHQFNPTDAPNFNVSHTVNSLSFGPEYPGMASPLQGVSKNCDTSTGLYQYFIKLVPTLYDGGKTRTIRYSYTHRFRPLKLDPALQHDDHHAHARAHMPTALLPGVFWVYDLSAFMVQVNRHRPTISHFLVRLCAIVGGVTTIVTALGKVIIVT